MSPTSCHCSTPRYGENDRLLGSTVSGSPLRSSLYPWVLGGAHVPSLPAVKPPVPSAQPRFTTRFGMERGGSTALVARHWFRVLQHREGLPRSRRLDTIPHQQCSHPSARAVPSWRRATELAREALVHAHVSPLPLAGPPAHAAYPVIFWGTYLAIPVRRFILGRSSHLDAFSSSCSRT